MSWLLHFMFVGSALSVEIEVAGVLSLEQVEQVGQYYHQRVGIPLAEAIRIAELASNNTNTITNGTLPEEFPFTGSFHIYLSSGATSMCAGTLISSGRLVTSAHCVWDGQERGVNFIGSVGSMMKYSDGTKFSANETILHPDYNTRTLANDIALLKIPIVTYSAYVAPISLPTGTLLQIDLEGFSAQAIDFRITNNDCCLLSSDGRGTKNQFLGNFTLKVVSNETCRRKYGDITMSKLCAGGKDVCFGGSGGPLVITYEGKQVLIGVSSFVSSNSCQSGRPAGFTRVSTFVPWIQSNLE